MASPAVFTATVPFRMVISPEGLIPFDAAPYVVISIFPVVAISTLYFVFMAWPFSPVVTMVTSPAVIEVGAFLLSLSIPSPVERTVSVPPEIVISSFAWIPSLAASLIWIVPAVIVSAPSVQSPCLFFPRISRVPFPPTSTLPSLKKVASSPSV